MLVRDLITHLMTLDPEALVVIPRDGGYAVPNVIEDSHFRPHNAAGGWVYTTPRPDTTPCVVIAATD